VCAELLPEIIELDSWGYPVVMAAGVPADLVEQAKRAAPACPVLVLALVTRSRRRPVVDATVPNQHRQRPLEQLFTRS